MELSSRRYLKFRELPVLRWRPSDPAKTLLSVEKNDQEQRTKDKEQSETSALLFSPLWPLFRLSKLRRLPPLPGLKVAVLPRAVAKLRWHHEKVSLVRATSGGLLS